MQLDKAKEIAQGVLDHLKPYAEIIHIGGSIRRQKPEVKDIEIIMLPKFVVVNEQGSLFGESEKTEKVHPEILTVLNNAGKILKGNIEGRYMQIDLSQGIKLDLFMPQKHDYYRILAIRTGSSSFANYKIAWGWKKKGWVGTSDGLRLNSECVQKSGGTYECKEQEPTLPPEWKSEEEFFNWLGLEWAEPKLRT